ncbi:MAG: hypothetical protein PHY47_00450 [Lachnospiraceae bacterium]|nr:hypothetical protein [Lachnospiraceae bacterium]
MIKTKDIKKKTPTKKKSNTAQAPSAIVQIISNDKGNIVKLKDPVQNYGRRQMFVPCEYDLSQISLIEDGESYVRQAFSKKTSLMFKEGEVFAGKNAATIDYVKSRIRQIEYVTGIPWRALLKMTGKELISKSNFFWVKVRKESVSGGTVGVNRINPVAGYFPMAAETVKVKKDKNGKIIKYRQEMPDGRWQEFSPSDVIHFRCDVKPGFTFGTPSLIPVIPDIQALRRLEENVEILFYQTLFPIFQYTVGTDDKPAGMIALPDGSMINEVDYIRQQIAFMPSEGGIVTPERHKIEYIGANGEIPNYQQVLAYFKGRVLTGLGISSIDIGDGDSSNRATADSLSKALIDSVKSYQDVMEQIINSQVVYELLLEADFGFDPLTDQNIVEMQFIEIDIEEQMKKNVNAQLLYNADIIDINEAREVTGRQPITSKQEKLMFTERQTVKLMEVQHDMNIELSEVQNDLDKDQNEQMHNQALEAAEHSASVTPPEEKKSVTTGGGKRTVTVTKKGGLAKKSKAAANSAKNISSPTNQHGTKTGPQKSRLDGWIRNEERLLDKLQEVISKDSPEYMSCLMSAKLRLRKKAHILTDETERESFLQAIENTLYT